MGKNILIVDDEQSILDILSEFLQEEGYVIFTADRLQEAFDHLTAVSIDLILCDSLTQNPVESLQTFQQLKKVTTTPIILLTAHNSVFYEDYKNMGLAGVVFKPFDLDELLARVSSILPNLTLLGE